MNISAIYKKQQKQFKLLESIRNNDYKSVVLALKSGANPNQSLPLYEHPMKECLDFTDDIRILETLIEYGGDPSIVIPFDGKIRSLGWVANKLHKPEFSATVSATKSKTANRIPKNRNYH